MSVNVRDLIKGPIYEWVCINADPSFTPPKNANLNFWVTPLDQQDPEYSTVVDCLIQEFTSTTTLVTGRIEEIVFRILQRGDQKFLLIGSQDGSLRSPATPPADWVTWLPGFLQTIHFVTSEKLPALTAIPSRLLSESFSKGEALFEDDLRPHIPTVIAWEIPESRREDGRIALLCSAILTIEPTPTNSMFREEFFELALSLPVDADHSWLGDQFFFALRCRRIEHAYLALYRMLEFFFPLRGILSLREQLGFDGGFIELRKHCAEALGWNMNHQAGVRAAAQYTSTQFAASLLGRDQKDGEDTNRFKVEALEKMALLRHQLAHQSFSSIELQMPDLERFTKCLLLALVEAFRAYGRIYIAAPRNSITTAAELRATAAN